MNRGRRLALAEVAYEAAGGDGLLAIALILDAIKAGRIEIVGRSGQRRIRYAKRPVEAKAA